MLSPYYQFPSLVCLTPLLHHAHPYNCHTSIQKWKLHPTTLAPTWKAPGTEILGPIIFVSHPSSPGPRRTSVTDSLELQYFLRIRIRDFSAYNNVHDPSQHHLLTSSTPNLCHWLLSLLLILTTSLHLITSILPFILWSFFLAVIQLVHTTADPHCIIATRVNYLSKPSFLRAVM